MRERTGYLHQYIYLYLATYVPPHALSRYLRVLYVCVYYALAQTPGWVGADGCSETIKFRLACKYVRARASTGRHTHTYIHIYVHRRTVMMFLGISTCLADMCITVSTCSGVQCKYREKLWVAGTRIEGASELERDGIKFFWVFFIVPVDY